ncbi:HEAT repeat domain-containing protein [Streptomyces chartreusis]|uniref:HEAT repeat domain-containing protein n=1 Tax=Streptomyces chartreusis TaxID=1969 RepID=UPI002E81786E|nr:HEAT repeat domain-containing protein [Streptomyces chartreusis]WUB23802.1 HEAT repeat domain-containing protein [Streptomyces chartreusis]
MSEAAPSEGRTSQRLVLKDEVSWQDLREFTEEHEWRYIGMMDRDPDKRIYREAKWEVGSALFAHYVEDEFADERFIIATGGSADSRNRALAEISESVAVWSFEDLLYEVSGAAYPAGRARAVMRLGVGSPLQAVDSAVNRIERASKDSDLRVRKAAVWAMAYSDWPQYRPVLEIFVEREKDPQLAHSASLILQSLGEPE